LAANGFDFSICCFGIATELATPYPIRMDVTEYQKDIFGIVPYPTFSDMWNVLPKKVGYSKINIEDKIIIYKDFYNGIVSVDINENLCEAACKMWLKLKEQNLL